MCEAQSWRPPHFINVPVGDIMILGHQSPAPPINTHTHTHTERQLYDLHEDDSVTSAVSMTRGRCF